VADAIVADLAWLSGPAERRAFAFGWPTRQRLIALLVTLAEVSRFVGVTVGFVVARAFVARCGGVSPCGLCVPLAVWRWGVEAARRRGWSGSRRAMGRRSSSCRRPVVCGRAGFLAAVVPPEGHAVVVAALAVLVAVLADTWWRFALPPPSPRPVRARSLCGALRYGAGIAWCALMPFTGHRAARRLALAREIALALVAVALPAAAALAAIRSSGEVGQGVLAGADRCRRWPGHLVAGGTTSGLSSLIDSGLLDGGPQWRPPDLIEQVVPSISGFCFWLPLRRVDRLADRVAVSSSASVLGPLGGGPGRPSPLVLLAGRLGPVGIHCGFGTTSSAGSVVPMLSSLRPGIHW